MLIKYVHFSAPDTERTYDTERSLKGSRGLVKTAMSQENWDKQELARFACDLAKGVILRYELVGKEGL